MYLVYVTRETTFGTFPQLIIESRFQEVWSLSTLLAILSYTCIGEVTCEVIVPMRMQFDRNVHAFQSTRMCVSLSDII